MRAYAVSAMSRYWPAGSEAIRDLPIAVVAPPEVEPLPPSMVEVSLPDWAAEVGVDGALLVPAGVVPDAGGDWKSVDWLAAIFWYVSGAAERAHERQYGPIHSYSARLRGWDARIWQRAWANRIALFLRRWAAHRLEQEEATIFGALPSTEVVLTHDVDAVSKTLPIRVKQAAFHAFNLARALIGGELGAVASRNRAFWRALLGRADYWCFERITGLEEDAGQRSQFNFYGGRSGFTRWPWDVLMDPGYDVRSQRLRDTLCGLAARGFTVGVHPSFRSWRDSPAIQRQRERVQSAVDAPVTSCRQHWLRFSWERTWVAQEDAGLTLDTTLGFNDRPGFRNGAAVAFHPWNAATGAALRLVALPMVLMDSHLYDYRELAAAERDDAIRYWLGELHAVHGTATVVWHVRVMSEEYGWAEGYESLLSNLPQ